MQMCKSAFKLSKILSRMLRHKTPKLAKNDLRVQNFLSLASDGASVMVGKNNGVSALIKRENSRLVNIP